MSPSIATNTEVDREGLLDFVRPRHRMVLTTRRRGGAPQLSPVTGGVDDEAMALFLGGTARRLLDRTARAAGTTTPSA